MTELETNTEFFNKEFKHRAAVFITGMTPAVVTETLCMLLRGECHSHLTSGGNHRFAPTEIHIITTRGDDTTNSADVFIKQWKTRGLAEMLNCLKEYDVKDITIDLWFITKGADVKECWADSATNKLAAEIREIKPAAWSNLKIRAHNAAPSGSGNELSDIRTDAENSAAGDYIARVLRRLTHGDGCDQRAIHASMAGGRKTMSGYVKGAMWLLGRAQDRLSHVLVDRLLEKADWEGMPIVGETAKRAATASNYLLKGEKNEITHSDGAVHQAITLTDVPFVRLGAILAPGKGFGAEQSYSELVNQAHTLVRAMQSQTITMELTCNNRQVAFPGFDTVTLDEQHFALLLLLAAQRHGDLKAHGKIRVGFDKSPTMQIFEKFKAAFYRAYVFSYGENPDESGNKLPGVVTKYLTDKKHGDPMRVEIAGLATRINKSEKISDLFRNTYRIGLIVSDSAGKGHGPAYRLSDKLHGSINVTDLNDAQLKSLKIIDGHFDE